MDGAASNTLRGRDKEGEGELDIIGNMPPAPSPSLSFSPSPTTAHTWSLLIPPPPSIMPSPPLLLLSPQPSFSFGCLISASQYFSLHSTFWAMVRRAASRPRVRKSAHTHFSFPPPPPIPQRRSFTLLPLSPFPLNLNLPFFAYVVAHTDPRKPPDDDHAENLFFCGFRRRLLFSHARIRTLPRSTFLLRLLSLRISLPRLFPSPPFHAGAQATPPPFPFWLCCAYLGLHPKAPR